MKVIKVLIERGSLKVTFEVFQYLFYGVLEKENIIVWSVKTGIHDKQESCYVRKREYVNNGFAALNVHLHSHIWCCETRKGKVLLSLFSYAF